VNSKKGYQLKWCCENKFHLREVLLVEEGDGVGEGEVAGDDDCDRLPKYPSTDNLFMLLSKLGLTDGLFSSCEPGLFAPLFRIKLLNLFLFFFIFLVLSSGRTTTTGTGECCKQYLDILPRSIVLKSDNPLVPTMSMDGWYMAIFCT
jgi:hypothetical protein